MTHNNYSKYGKVSESNSTDGRILLVLNMT